MAYDGFFYDSAITASVRLRNGTTRTIPIPNADYPSFGPLTANSTPPQLVASYEHDTDQIGNHVTSAERRQILTSLLLGRA
ncbi:MAG: hypothetical protein ACLP22_16610 [Solirubrobacteraceae bacterium]